jgi:hypothetical protein
MIISGKAEITALAAIIEQNGGTVTWGEGARPDHVTTSVKVEIDEEQTARKLAEAGWFGGDEDGPDDCADARDVRDFVAACTAGDRQLAQALAPRIFVSDANQAAIERGLFGRSAQ